MIRNPMLAATVDPWRAPPSSPVTVTTSPNTDPWSPVPSTTTATIDADTNKKSVKCSFL